jgi:hypothetical protein
VSLCHCVTVSCFPGSLFPWFTDSLIHRFTGSLVHWFTVHYSGIPRIPRLLSTLQVTDEIVWVSDHQLTHDPHSEWVKVYKDDDGEPGFVPRNYIQVVAEEAEEEGEEGEEGDEEEEEEEDEEEDEEEEEEEDEEEEKEEATPEKKEKAKEEGREETTTGKEAKTPLLQQHEDHAAVVPR